VRLLAIRDESLAVEAAGQIDLTQAELPFRLELDTHQALHWQDIEVSEAGLQLSGNLESYQIGAQTRLVLPEQPPVALALQGRGGRQQLQVDRKSTRLNSSHVKNSYAVV